MNKLGNTLFCLLITTALFAPPLTAGAQDCSPDRGPDPGSPHAAPLTNQSSVAAENGPGTELSYGARLLGLAGLGIMLSLLGSIWIIYFGSARRHRRRIHEAPGAASYSRGCHPSGSPRFRHRVRRFDYDRFYLHMTKDL